MSESYVPLIANQISITESHPSTLLDSSYLNRGQSLNFAYANSLLIPNQIQEKDTIEKMTVIDEEPNDNRIQE